MINSTPFEGFSKLTNLIGSGSPFLIGRLSGNETAFCGNELYNISSSHSTLKNLTNVAGIQFSSQESKKKYVKFYSQSFRSCDLVVNFPDDSTIHKLNHNFNQYCNEKFPGLCHIHLRTLEPYYFMEDKDYKFNEQLEGKKILVISSHLCSMKKQLSKLNYLFPKNIFKKNRFSFIKPPITHGNVDTSNDWQNHWQNLINKVKEESFDIALVSCGGYGMVTAAFIREKLNKSAIYVGGALQIWFGIKGKRWDQHPIISNFYNKHWVRPQNSEMPNGHELIEGSCYW